MPAQTGWEETADYALSWATEQAASWAARPLTQRACAVEKIIERVAPSKPFSRITKSATYR